MIRIFVFLVIFTARGTCNVESMYKVVKSSVKLLESSIDKFETLFKYALPGYRCIQVITDHSSFADYHMDDLHQCFSVPPILNGYWGEDHGCEGFVVLSSSLQNIESFLKNYPLHAEHRFIVIFPPVSYYKLVSLNNKIKKLGDSDLLFVSIQNLSVAFKLGQPDRKRFEVVDNFTVPWEAESTILDFHGRKIKALTYNCSLFSHVSELNSDLSANWTHGAEMLVFNEIAEVLNLTIEWSVLSGMPDHAIFFNTKKWYMKPVLNQNSSSAVDVAFCGLTLSYKKMLSDLDMSEPLVLLCFEFLVPRPKVIQAEWNSIFRVFNTSLWFTVILAMLVTALVLQNVTKYTRVLVQTVGIDKYVNLGGSTMQLLSILVLSDVPPSMKTQGASRFILSSWSFSALILTTCFSSGLVSHLTSQSYTKKINTIEELVQNKFNWGFLYQPDYSELLNTRGNVMHARLKMRAVQMDNVEEHIASLNRGRQFLWGVRIYNWFFLPEEELPDSVLKRFEASGECFIEYFLSFAFRTGSPFVRSFDRYIRTYKETGLMKRDFDQILLRHSIKRKYTYEVLRLTTATLSGGSLSLGHLTGIIEVWAVGVCCSIVIFILEMLQKCHI